MPTARELLEQADALMRRNRAHNAPTLEEETGATDIPVLTDAIESSATQASDTGLPPRDALQGDAARAPAAPAPVLALDDVPVLTDAVEEIEATTIAEVPEQDDEPSRWLETPHGQNTITGSLPDSIILVPPANEPSARGDREMQIAGDAARIGDERPADRSAIEEQPVGEQTIEITAPAPSDGAGNVAADDPEQSSVGDDVDELALDELEAPSAPSLDASMPAPALSDGPDESADIAHRGERTVNADDEQRWRALAEEIRMQVLQRIDIFTDAGLREQLTARLQPIVDRASADLVATINQQVGELIRTYAAEAIEQEIDKWRHDGG